MRQQRISRRNSPQRFTEYARLASSTVGAKFWLPAVVVLIVAVVLIPVVWVLLAHWGGLSLGSAGDLGVLLATIGGIMGAVFTVGGLIIALVSVYTQLAIEDRIRRSFEALQPELDERARSQIEAYLAFSRATEQHNWRTADSLAREALAKWPSLQGVRSTLGERMSNDVTTWFHWNILEPQTVSDQLYGPPRFFWDYQADSLLFGNPPSIIHESEDEVPKFEAIQWLQDAIDHGEDADGVLQARLACMYGVSGRYDDVIQHVRKALAGDSGLKQYLTAPTNLAMLAYACRDSQRMISRLENLGALLGIELPASAEEVLRSLETFQGSPLQSPWTARWVALKRSGREARPATQMALSTIHIVLGDATGTRSGWANWMAGTSDQIVALGAGSFVPIADLVPQLSERFVFICQR